MPTDFVVADPVLLIVSSGTRPHVKSRCRRRPSFSFRRELPPLWRPTFVQLRSRPSAWKYSSSAELARLDRHKTGFGRLVDECTPEQKKQGGCAGQRAL